MNSDTWQALFWNLDIIGSLHVMVLWCNLHIQHIMNMVNIQTSFQSLLTNIFPQSSHVLNSGSLTHFQSQCELISWNRVPFKPDRICLCTHRNKLNPQKKIIIPTIYFLPYNFSPTNNEKDYRFESDNLVPHWLGIGEKMTHSWGRTTVAFKRAVCARQKIPRKAETTSVSGCANSASGSHSSKLNYKTRVNIIHNSLK